MNHHSRALVHETHTGSHSTVRLPELKQKVNGMLELANEFPFSHYSGVFYLPILED